MKNYRKNRLTQRKLVSGKLLPQNATFAQIRYHSRHCWRTNIPEVKTLSVSDSSYPLSKSTVVSTICCCSHHCSHHVSERPQLNYMKYCTTLATDVGGQEGPIMPAPSGLDRSQECMISDKTFENKYCTKVCWKKGWLSDNKSSFVW